MVNGTTYARSSQIEPMRAQSGPCPDQPAAVVLFVRKARPRRHRRVAPPHRRPIDEAQRPASTTTLHRRRSRDECTELARALHDDLAQLLSYALIQLDLAGASLPGTAACRDAALQHGRDLIKDALRTTRDVIGSLLDAAQPIAPTFDAQVLLMASEMTRLTREAIDVDCAPVTVTPPPAVCKILLRAARELLANACKHAPGSRIRLTLRQETRQDARPAPATAAGPVPWVVLTISDTGPGFDPSLLCSTDRGHFGLRHLPGMLQQIGAVFRIDSPTGAGVRAQVRWAAPMVAR